MLSWSTPPNLVPVVAGRKPPANLPPGSVTFETPMRSRRSSSRKTRSLPYLTTSGFRVVGEPLFSNQSIPSLTRSNFST